MKPIAILSSNWYRTIEWMKNTFEITEIDGSRNRLMDSRGREYFVIQKKHQLYGYEFDSYLKAPDFETLETLVQQRIR